MYKCPNKEMCTIYIYIYIYIYTCIICYRNTASKGLPSKISASLQAEAPLSTRYELLPEKDI